MKKQTIHTDRNAFIDDTLKKIGDTWKRVPDWRFGQLIANVFEHNGGNGLIPAGDVADEFKAHMFYQDDSAFLKFLDKYVQASGIKNLTPKPVVTPAPNTSDVYFAADMNFLHDASRAVIKKMSEGKNSGITELSTDDAIMILDCLYDAYLTSDIETKSAIRTTFNMLLNTVNF